METMKIKYWGVRGSVPTPLTTEEIREKQIALIKELFQNKKSSRVCNFGGEFTEDNARAFLDNLPLSITGTYGGDTTCIEVQAKDTPLIVIDAGTGAKNLGKTLAGRLFSKGDLNPLNNDAATAKDIHMPLTHYHWDHIQGLPFCTPLFIHGDKKVNVHFYGRKGAQQQLSDVLRGQQTCPNFPVAWEDMPCNKYYHELGITDNLLIDDSGIINKIQRYNQTELPQKFIEARLLIEKIVGNGGKVVIWTTFIHNILAFSSYMTSNGIPNKVIYGAIPVDSNEDDICGVY